MNPGLGIPVMRRLRASSLILCGIVMIQLLTAQVDAQRSKSPWQTLSGDPPRVIARGGFSGLFPDSSLDAYNMAIQTSVPGTVLWCDVQLTKDGAGICFPDLTMSNASSIQVAYPKRQNSYVVNGVPTLNWFTIDFTLKELKSVFLIRGVLSRSDAFDGNAYGISTVQSISTQMKPDGFWLNVQHDTFYAQHNLSMSKFLLSASRNIFIDYISSPEVNFFRKVAGSFGRSGPTFVFRFLGKDEIEPTTNQTYGSIMGNLTFVKTFASAILVPKSYIWPLDSQYLLPHTSLVQNAHKEGLEVYASGFANDIDIAYNFSFDPLAEYISFVDNGNFSVDGVLSDFPISASAALDCFAHLGKNATKKVDFLVISKNGASGDYPGCTDLAYVKAIKDGADVIDCSVQMSSDGVPFCLNSIDLGNSSTVAQSVFRNRSTIVPEISPVGGIYSFSLTWSEIQTLTPAISNPWRLLYSMFRNPKERNSGKFISLSDFLNLAKNSTSLSGVLISVESAAYLREKQGLDVVKAVLDTLTDTGYNNKTTTKVMIQSTNSSVLVDFKKQSQYDTVYKIEETIRDILDSAVEDIKKFANAVVIGKTSVFPVSNAFVTGQTTVVERLQKAKLPVYVEVFQNEFVSQPYDFFSDATVEINSHISGAGINGTITEFPLTAARYRKNRCLAHKETPSYMAPVQPGGLLSIVSTSLGPAQAPNPVFTDADVTEPPLPPVTAKPPTSTPGSPANPGNSAQAPSGQTRLTLSLLISIFAMVLASLLLL